MNGTKTPPWLRILALSTAVGLGGTYVWRQQQKAPTPQVPPQKVEPAERTVISSSKSMIIDPLPMPEEEAKTNLPAIQQVPKADQRIIMPGSKSGSIFRPEPEPQVPDPPKQRTMLPGSKSRPILEPPSEERP